VNSCFLSKILKPVILSAAKNPRILLIAASAGILQSLRSLRMTFPSVAAGLRNLTHGRGCDYGRPHRMQGVKG